MRIGGLNRRIQIQTPSTAVDTYGQQISSWTTVYTCWAEISIQASQLLYETAEFVSKVTHRITFRWTSSFVVQPQMRIIYTEPTTQVVHTYVIEALLNTNQRNRELVAIAYELNAQE